MLRRTRLGIEADVPLRVGSMLVRVNSGYTKGVAVGVGRGLVVGVGVGAGDEPLAISCCRLPIIRSIAL